MSEANRLRFFELVERCNQLDTMLPASGDFNTDDIEAVATVRVVIAEMPQHGNRWTQFWMPK